MSLKSPLYKFPIISIPVPFPSPHYYQFAISSSRTLSYTVIPNPLIDTSSGNIKTEHLKTGTTFPSTYAITKN